MKLVLQGLVSFFFLSHSLALHGVLDQDLSKYESSPFTCFDKSKTIPSTSINDDYCDCADGSDEPGTSACAPVGTFSCKNKHFKPAKIPSSHVLDGICDVECCDGSDEFNLVTQSSPCPNTCEALAKQAEEKVKERLMKIQVGLDKKKEYIAIGKQLKETRAIENVQWKDSLEELNKQKIALEQEQIKVKQEELNATRILCTPMLDSFLLWLEKIQAQTRELKVKALDSVPLLDLPIKKKSPVNEQATTGDAFNANAVEFHEVVEAQPIEMDACKDYRKLLSEWTDQLKNGVDSIDIASDKDVHELSKQIEQQIQQVELNMTSIKNSMENHQQREALDFGPSRVFDALYGQCHSIHSGEYDYEMCFFTQATQKRSHEHISLGRFTRWSGPNENPFTEMLFENGQSCWNGPMRSLRVKFLCGPTEKILSVSEPAKCEYIMKMETPSVCEQVRAGDEEFDWMHTEL